MREGRKLTLTSLGRVSQRRRSRCRNSSGGPTPSVPSLPLLVLLKLRKFWTPRFLIGGRQVPCSLHQGQDQQDCVPCWQQCCALGYQHHGQGSHPGLHHAGGTVPAPARFPARCSTGMPAFPVLIVPSPGPSLCGKRRCIILTMVPSRETGSSSTSSWAGLPRNPLKSTPSQRGQAEQIRWTAWSRM